MTEDQLNLLYLRNNSRQAVQAEPPAHSAKVEERRPRPYLKRGSGLARFNLSTDLEKQPNRVKKKVTNITNLTSKYTEVREDPQYRNVWIPSDFFCGRVKIMPQNWLNSSRNANN